MKEKYEMAVMDSFLKKEISLEFKDYLMEIASIPIEIEVEEGYDYSMFLEMTIRDLEKNPSKLMELFNLAQDDHAI